MTRTEFEETIRPDLERTIKVLHRALSSAAAEGAQLDAILLIGGSSRIPLVCELISAEFGQASAIDTDPKTAVAGGAARLLAPATVLARETADTVFQLPAVPPERPQISTMLSGGGERRRPPQPDAGRDHRAGNRPGSAIGSGALPEFIPLPRAAVCRARARTTTTSRPTAILHDDELAVKRTLGAALACALAGARAGMRTRRGPAARPRFFGVPVSSSPWSLPPPPGRLGLARSTRNGRRVLSISSATSAWAA